MMSRENKPEFPEAYYGYGRVLCKLGKKSEGIEMIKKSLDKPFSYMSVKSKQDVEKMLEEYENSDGE